jgi:hypothetical protein
LITKIPDKEYHAIKDRCSASVLKSLRRSPAHMKQQQDDPKESESMALGSLFHCQTLEPSEFSDRYVRVSKIDKRTKEYREAAATGLIVVDDEACRTAYQMACSAKDHSKAGKLLNAAEFFEGAVLFEIDGIPCKAKIDFFAHGRVCDLKSTRDASPESFQKDFVKFGYHVQGAFYRRAARAAGLDCSGFVIVATENSEPHLTAVYELSENALRLGDQIINRLLPVWWECRQTQVYPGYPEVVTVLDLPAWELKNLDDKPVEKDGIIQF